jgi:putative spermidine/putrescine transport system ATP-binding protein
MSCVVFESVSRSYGTTVALEHFDIELQEGEFLALLGPSGCGKTTALRLLAGFIGPTGGRIFMDGVDLAHVPPERRDIGMVFQEYALFPHMTVLENVAFGLRERRQRGAAALVRARELLQLVRLPDLEGRYPAELSGGQQQRVALARAVAFGPRLLLMDEPLGALDLKLREAMQIEIKRIQRTLGITTLYVTHDQGEAISMADRIAVMNRGRIVQLGTPPEVYDRPRSRFVADFLGRVNLATAGVLAREDGWLHVGLGAARLAVPLPGRRGPAAEGSTVCLAVRPESLRLGGKPRPGDNVLEGRVVQRIFAGSILKVMVEIAGTTTWTAEVPPDSPIPSDGSSLQLSWSSERTTLLEED